MGVSGDTTEDSICESGVPSVNFLGFHIKPVSIIRENVINMAKVITKHRMTSVKAEQRGSNLSASRNTHFLTQPHILTHLQKFSPLNSSTLPFPLCSAPSTFWMLLGRPSFSMLRGPRTLWPVYTQNRVPIDRKRSL